MSNQQQSNNKRRNNRDGGGNRSSGGAARGGSGGSGGRSSGNGSRAAAGAKTKPGGGGDNKGSNRRRKGPRKKKVDPQVFWGNPELLAGYDPPSATITSNPSAVVLSLGRPPLSGQQNASELYFTAVYERAVNLAAALAAAGDLLEPEEI